MWGYYGSKSKIVKKYPAPKFDKIIEPFAGTAQYSLLYWDRDIILVDKYTIIVKIWKWLQSCSKADILSLPRLKHGENVDDFLWDCIEAKWMIGFIITGAPSQPKKTASYWKTVVRPNTQEYKLDLIADSLEKIRHWKIVLGDYRSIKNTEATWFVDPPYQFGGEYYHSSVNNAHINYRDLSQWISSRKGQVIACENSNANWMEFSPLSNMRGNKKKSVECIWTQTNL